MNIFSLLISSIKHWATEQINELSKTTASRIDELSTSTAQQINDLSASTSDKLTELEVKMDKPFREKSVKMLEFEIPSTGWHTVSGPGGTGYETNSIDPTVSLGSLEIDKTYEVSVNDEYFGEVVFRTGAGQSGSTTVVNADGDSFKLTISYNGYYKQYTVEVDSNYNAENIDTTIVRIYTKDGVVLDEDYIPDTIARVEDITEGFSGSWNDLTDKPFGERDEVILAFYDRVYSAIRPGVYGKQNDMPDVDNGSLLNGETYRFVVNHKTYGEFSTDWVCTTVDGSTTDYINLGYNSDGDPVSLKLTPNSDKSYRVNILNIDRNSVSVIVYKPGVIKPLDEKYIPDTIVRKSLETVPDSTGETVSSEEFNALLAVLRNNGIISA